MNERTELLAFVISGDDVGPSTKSNQVLPVADSTQVGGLRGVLKSGTEIDGELTDVDEGVLVRSFEISSVQFNHGVQQETDLGHRASSVLLARSDQGEEETLEDGGLVEG